MSRGGTRKGAGAFAGQVRPKMNDYWTQDEIKNFMEHLKKQAYEDPRIATYVADHLLGKAVQPIGNDGDKPFLVQGVEIQIRK